MGICPIKIGNFAPKEKDFPLLQGGVLSATFIGRITYSKRHLFVTEKSERRHDGAKPKRILESLGSGCR